MKTIHYQVAIKEFIENGCSEVRIAERLFCNGRPVASTASRGGDATAADQKIAFDCAKERLLEQREGTETARSLVFPDLTLKDAAIVAFGTELAAAGIDLDVGRLEIE